MTDMCFGSPEPAPPREPVTEPAHPPPPKRRRGINEARRRHAIAELFDNMGSPNESKWKGHGGTVSQIRRALRLPAGADRCIHQVLERVVAEGDDFDGGRRAGGGRHAKLSLAEAMIAADELEAGVGQTQATFILRARYHRARAQQPARAARSQVHSTPRLRGICACEGRKVCLVCAVRHCTAPRLGLRAICPLHAVSKITVS